MIKKLLNWIKRDELELITQINLDNMQLEKDIRNLQEKITALELANDMLESDAQDRKRDIEFMKKKFEMENENWRIRADDRTLQYQYWMAIAKEKHELTDEKIVYAARQLGRRA